MHVTGFEAFIFIVYYVFCIQIFCVFRAITCTCTCTQFFLFVMTLYHLYYRARPHSLFLRNLAESGQQAVADGQATSGEEERHMEQSLGHLEHHR